MGSIALENVRKASARHTHPAVNLDIEDGEFAVFVGPSGCGKSTLLRLIAGLEDIIAGSHHVDGKDMTERPSRPSAGSSMVFQSYALYPHMSVRNNIAFALKMAGQATRRRSTRRSRTRRAMLNLTDYLDRKPRQLSGGQRQRVAIGRAIVREPKAFLFDEPLSNLDAALRVQMRLEIGELHQQLKTTMIYVTHDQVEAMTMADKIVVLERGKIEQVGSPLELYNTPANLFVAGFIGSPTMNFVDGAGPAKRGAQSIGIRPEHIACRQGQGDWQGKVRVAEHLGSDTFIYAEVDGLGLMTVRVEGEEASSRATPSGSRPTGAHLSLRQGGRRRVNCDRRFDGDGSRRRRRVLDRTADDAAAMPADRRGLRS